ncbi:hypothetical protein [Sinomonas terrae]|uniref:Response regulatory domain-containing protein n=1 Tax=Sinomonas terrae TaxID=2908838 RepID=A0ABS9U5Y3_9MICC|nr:hypothetical protein [Sinomonas terrae]MCH6472085.1 hypothetical protein [Sinomonas terrae]
MDEESREGLLVFVLSEHGPLRRALRDLLGGEGMEVVGESASAAEALALIAELRPRVLVLDSRTPDRNPFRVLRRARDVLPTLGCVALISYPHQRPAPPAVPPGCVFVLREIANHNLPAAIRDAAAKERAPEGAPNGTATGRAGA